jgi:hypothetical protein
MIDELQMSGANYLGSMTVDDDIYDVDNIDIGAIAQYARLSASNERQQEVITGAPASGDFDGDGRVTMTEVINTLNVVIGRGVFTPAQKASVDMDGDGVVTMTDVIKVLRRSVGLD